MAMDPIYVSVAVSGPFVTAQRTLFGCLYRRCWAYSDVCLCDLSIDGAVIDWCNHHTADPSVKDHGYRLCANFWRAGNFNRNIKFLYFYQRLERVPIWIFCGAVFDISDH